MRGVSPLRAHKGKKTKGDRKPHRIKFDGHAVVRAPAGRAAELAENVRKHLTDHWGFRFPFRVDVHGVKRSTGGAQGGRVKESSFNIEKRSRESNKKVQRSFDALLETMATEPRPGVRFHVEGRRRNASGQFSRSGRHLGFQGSLYPIHRGESAGQAAKRLEGVVAAERGYHPADDDMYYEDYFEYEIEVTGDHES